MTKAQKKKHDWNSLENHLHVHDRVLRHYAPHITSSAKYNLKEITPYYYEYFCKGLVLKTFKGTAVKIEIRKELEVDRSVQNRLRSRTIDYTYVANLSDGRRLLRYCSPHPGKQSHADSHHRFHHKHVYSTDGSERIIPVGSDDWPHVSEFFDEVLDSF